MSIMPDDKVPTAVGKKMKSGYGVKTTVSTSASSSAPPSHYTGAQNTITYFPEFRYETYWRLLERTSSGVNAKLEFANNIYSTYYRRVHFTPLWIPDGDYTVYGWVIDMWTPVGMLCVNVNDYVTIGGTLYDDWHVGPAPVD